MAYVPFVVGADFLTLSPFVTEVAVMHIELFFLFHIQTVKAGFFYRCHQAAFCPAAKECNV